MNHSREALDEIARRHDESIESGRELEGLVPVNARVSKPTGSVHSTRFTYDEISLVHEAAEKQGMTTSAFIRTAALAAAAGELNLASAGKAAEWQKIRRLARELGEVVDLQAEEKKASRRKKAS